MARRLTYGREARLARAPGPGHVHRRWPLVVGALVLLALLLFFTVLPPLADTRNNRVANPPPYDVPQRAAALHRSLLVADLHADSLLWGRDLLERGKRGHVDVPRLVDGNVALQAFTIVNRVPFERDYASTAPGADAVTLIAIAGRWPFATWNSRAARALYQALRLDALAAASGGRLTLVRSVSDLHRYLDRRRRERGITAGLLGVEGGDALEGNLANIDRFYAAGIRMLGLVHYLDNALGGSVHGLAKGGLTPLGRDVVLRMEQRRMIVDLAHASEPLFDDVIALARRPVVVSHTGVRGTCDTPRNLSDRQLRAVAASGGIVGIGYWPEAVCGDDAAAIARAVRHAVDVAGIRHVALGSDFDGAVTVPFDAGGLGLLTAALLDAGFDEVGIRLLMGENTLRLLQELLP